MRQREIVYPTRLKFGQTRRLLHIGAWVPEGSFEDGISGTDRIGFIDYAVRHLHYQGQAVSPFQSVSSKQACEHILQEEKRYNIAHNILPSENAIVDRLLARSPELAEAYEELHSKLNAHPGALRAFLGVVLCTAAFWSPEKIAEARAARINLTEVNRQIAQKAAEMAHLLQRRTELHDTSGFSSDTHYHVCEVIEASAKKNHLFASFVRDHLRGLRAQFDLKYWPTPSEFLQELASDAESTDIDASDPLTEASTAASRPSLADFFRALFAAIEENSAHHYGQFPPGFRATDNTLAAITNCALNLSPEDLVGGPYVKRLRQRERGGGM